VIDSVARFGCRENMKSYVVNVWSMFHVPRVDFAPLIGGADMALTIYTSKDNAWREYVNPLRGMTLERIVQLIELGERGAFADLQWFYQAMERSDALIATVLMRRRAALLSCEWHVRPEENPTDTVLAVEQAAYLRNQYDRVENLREAVAFLSSASFRGFAHVEKHFAEGGGGVVLLEPVEQWFWCREGMFGEWTYNRDARSGSRLSGTTWTISTGRSRCSAPAVC
jgi:phage gp29-like protein